MTADQSLTFTSHNDLWATLDDQDLFFSAAEYEDDFEAEDEETTPGDQSGSPTHSKLSHRAIKMIDSKMSEIFDSFAEAQEEKSQNGELKTK